jgi:large subunit ribosomal protein L6
MPIAPEEKRTVDIPSDVKITFKKNLLTVTGPRGSLERRFSHPRLNIKVAKDKVTVSSPMPKKKEGALVGTWHAHIKNMVEGVTKGFKYEMKVVYSHFPIKTAVKGKEFVIENFLGERHPRLARILGETKVVVSGDTVTLTGIDLETVSQSCANIELATRIQNYDPRTFQDGIYTMSKGTMEEGGE